MVGVFDVFVLFMDDLYRCAHNEKYVSGASFMFGGYD